MAAYDPVFQRKIDLFRRRFHSREDVFSVKYVTQRKEVDPVTQEEKFVDHSGVAPQCDNFWKPNLCLIYEKKGGCSECPNKKHTPLTDHWVSRHIRGEKDLVLFLLQKDGIRFGACDFDRGNPYEDAKLCHDYSVNVLRLPCFIARSSKKGYHLYWFFSDFIPAHFFTSMTRNIFTKVGIHSRAMENPEYSVPEVFPKQVSFSDDRIGNGIKVPMIEPRMKDGFNCWVNPIDAAPVPLESQWDHFEKMEEISLATLKQTLEAHQIEIIERAHSRSAGKTRNKGSLVDGQMVHDDDTERRPPTGDFFKVIKNCPALEQFWKKDESGNYEFDKGSNENGVPHNARFAAMTFAMSTKNGLDILKGHVAEGRKGWNEKTAFQLEQGIRTGYSPVTCQWLQEQNICRIGVHPKLHADPKDPESKKDHCLVKQPPVLYIKGGTRITNPDNLPENEWPDPSPIRFATQLDKATCAEVLAQLDSLFSFRKLIKVKDPVSGEEKEQPQEQPHDLSDQLHNLIRQAKRLGSDDFKRIQSHIRTHKYMLVKDVEKIEKQVRKEIEHEKLEEKRKTNRSFEWNKLIYTVEDEGYVASGIDIKGNPVTKRLTDFNIEIIREVSQYEGYEDSIDGDADDHNCSARFMICAMRIKGDPKTYKFRVQSDAWMKGVDSFFGTVAQQGDSAALTYDRGDYDAIRRCIVMFSKLTKEVKRKTTDIGHYKVGSEKKDVFIMPSVIVTRDEIKGNDFMEVSFKDDICKHIDFKVLSESEFKDLAIHILNDYFRCHSQVATMTAFAHAMAAAMTAQMPLQKSPILWIEGDFSKGKTFVGLAAQCFFGQFRDVVGTSGSGKSKVGAADHFRHATLLIDDFKQALDAWGAKDTIGFIQNAYDRSGRTALNRDGKLRERMAKVRGNIMITGEDVAKQEASALSRMIIVNINREGDRDHGNKVIENRNNYCGFTPYFIQYVFQTPERELKALFREYSDLFEKPLRNESTQEGSQRIAENLAYNMLAFRLAMDMLIARGVISVEQRDMYCSQHVKNLEIVRSTVCNYVVAHKASTVFVDNLRDILQNQSSYYIDGLPGTAALDHRNGKMLGFWRMTEPEVVYIIPSLAAGALEDHVRKNKGTLQDVQHISRQLVADGHIPEGYYDARENRYTKQIINPVTRMRVRTWAIRCKSLGIVPEDERPEKPLSPASVMDMNKEMAVKKTAG